MKKLIVVLVSLFATTGIYAQCNLSITNKTAKAISLVGAESEDYDCGSKVQASEVVTIQSGSTFSLNHSNTTFDNWIGIHITEPVNEPYRNYLAANCIAEEGSYKVIWDDECSVTIE